MKYKLLLCLMLVLAGLLAGRCPAANMTLNACSGTNSQPGQIYRDEFHGFQIILPKGWMAKEVGFDQNHYGYAFATINNQRRDLEVGNGWRPPEWDLNGNKTQLQTNEVYICVGYSAGPLPITMRKDAVDHDLQALLATNPLHFCSDGETAYGELDFFKRGKLWSIAVSMKEPVAEANRQKVAAILQSFRFLDGPVKNISWAESLAWRQLPPEFRASGSWNDGWPSVGEYDSMEESGIVDSRSVLVKKTGSAYSVRFTEGSALVRTWEFKTYENGKVIPISYQRTFHWQIIGKWVGSGAFLAALLACLLLLDRVALRESK